MGKGQEGEEGVGQSAPRVLNHDISGDEILRVGDIE